MNKEPVSPRGAGPHIVVIGGGNGLAAMLRGLKRHSARITAIVTMADDGGGSGVLRQDIGMPPPGDIRNCITALANTEPVMERLMDYRFPSGLLAGQSFGNLLLAALCGVTGSFEEAVGRMGEVLAITGRVLPVTTEDIRLEAVFENGAAVLGESRIFESKRAQNCRIREVRLVPAHPRALPAVLDALADADLIVLGPGSLYTSVIPNLLVDGVRAAVAASRAQKIYICNIMTQSGETEGYTAAEHVRAIFDHTEPGLFSLCLVNNAPVPEALAARYRDEGAEPVAVDYDALHALGVEVLERPLAAAHGSFVRHSPERLARELILLHGEENIRIAFEKYDSYRVRYAREQAEK